MVLIQYYQIETDELVVLLDEVDLVVVDELHYEVNEIIDETVELQLTFEVVVEVELDELDEQQQLMREQLDECELLIQYPEQQLHILLVEVDETEYDDEQLLREQQEQQIPEIEVDELVEMQLDELDEAELL